MSRELEIGWFGKLPSSGDFGFRRLPRSLLDDLDDWLRLGLTELRGSMPHDWKEVFTSGPHGTAPFQHASPAGIH